MEPDFRVTIMYRVWYGVFQVVVGCSKCISCIKRVNPLSSSSSRLQDDLEEKSNALSRDSEYYDFVNQCQDESQSGFHIRNAPYRLTPKPKFTLTLNLSHPKISPIQNSTSSRIHLIPTLLLSKTWISKFTLTLDSSHLQIPPIQYLPLPQVHLTPKVTL